MRVGVIDSHTAGEPTRVVISGAPDLGPGSAAQRAVVFRERCDWFRRAVVLEPRGWDALVGALLLEPQDPTAVAQVIFFNNVGPLHMCVHGALGVGATLAHLGRIGAGLHRLETPVGDVNLCVEHDGALSVRNVRSYRHARDVIVETADHGRLRGDVAWGGNWFFLVSDPGVLVAPDNLSALTACARDVRRSLRAAGVTGANQAEIDHVELFGPAVRGDADSKNFVLCPGDAYDRSPCGTGTSAKLACLAADGRLRPGETWGQESVIGSLFKGTFEPAPDKEGVVPTISGPAWVTAEATLLLDPADPFRHGIAAGTP